MSPHVQIDNQFDPIFVLECDFEDCVCFSEKTRQGQFHLWDKSVIEEENSVLFVDRKFHFDLSDFIVDATIVFETEGGGPVEVSVLFVDFGVPVENLVFVFEFDFDVEISDG